MKNVVEQIRSSLGLQIALPAAAVIFTLALLGIIAFYSQQRQSGIRLTLEKTASIAQLAATSAAPGVDFRNRESVQEALGGVPKISGFRFVVVRTVEGDTLFTNGFTAVPAALLAKSEAAAKSDSSVKSLVENGTAIAVTPIIGTSGKIGEVIFGISLEQMEQGVRDGVQAFAAVGIGGGIICAIVILLIVRKLVKPIVRLSDIAQKVSEGDLEQTMYTSSVNEVGGLSRAFNAMVGNIKQGVEALETEKLSVERKVEEAVRDAELQKRYLAFSIRVILEEMQRFAHGDLTVELTPAFEGDEIGELYVGFNEAISNIRTMLVSIVQALSETASTSSDIQRVTDDLASGTREQTTQAQDIAAQVEALATASLNNSLNADRALDVANRNGQTATSGGEIVGQTLTKIEEIASVVSSSSATVARLGESSAQIGEIVSVINEIADQTNLLALNAAIEAARAGEQGRGFSVVADEVRKLAERTSTATKEISIMVKNIQSESSAAVKAMNIGAAEAMKGKDLAGAAERALAEIVQSSDEVASVVHEIAKASREQSATSQSLAKNIDAMASITTTTESGATAIATLATELFRLMEQLLGLMQKFKINNRLRSPIE
ncbi:MAG: methyl-accepting chemotaxis protein [Candidatus Kapaibacteriota bacterium]|jgi:methyl-accepting chemotaxis protein